MRILLFIIYSTLISTLATASNLRTKAVRVSADTVRLDTLSIAPNSVLLYRNRLLVSDSLFTIDYSRGTLIAPGLVGEELEARYRVFDYNFSQPYRRRLLHLSGSTSSQQDLARGFGPQPDSDEAPSGVNTSGSIARGISLGNSQDIVLNSSMNLQMEGYITDNIQISAVISDQNIPIQPEGNTQHISEFDKVFIKLYDGGNAAIFGDFESSSDQGDFLRYTKKGLGARGEADIAIGETHRMTGNASFAISKGKYCRLDIAGMEGNQGPYRVYGCGGEAFISILSGSERVYLDGRLLKRGENLDYTIDYNAGELSFTSRRPISKDSRIAVEFEYSEQNYARFFVTENLSFKGRRSTSWINVFSEQDNRNQPFQQDTLGLLADALYRSGDGTVYVSNVMADTAWNANKIYYARRDTLLSDGRHYDSIYVYSTSQTVARYVLGFSYVGAGRGSYRRISSAANGKVFQWVAPSANGSLAGDYLPVRIVAAPQKTQLIVAGHRIAIGKGTELSVEAAVSNRDRNTASPHDNQDNVGGASAVGIEHIFRIDSVQRISLYGKYQLVGKDFESVADFRPMEFARDWSFGGEDNADEHLMTGGMRYRARALQAELSHSSFIRGGLYEGHKQSGLFSSEHCGFRSSVSGSVLHASANSFTSQYYRSSADLSQRVHIVRFGVLGEYELLNKRDSLHILMTESESFQRWGCYMESADSAGPQYRLSAVRRYDQKPDLLYRSLLAATNSADYSADLGLYRNENHTFAIGGTYRILRTSDTAWAAARSVQPESNLTARMEHTLALWKSSVRNRVFLETGSGLELKRDYNFVEVTPGQGSYMWIDYNGNGVPELNEFELAQYQQQANYMRVFLATNEYVRVYSNSFNHSFNADPYSLWRSADGWRRYAGRFAARTNYSFARKIDRTDFWQNIVPGQLFGGSAEVQSLQSNFRATLFANKPNHRLSGSYSYLSSQSKILSSNGTETRQTEENNANIRWNIIDILSAHHRAAIGRQTSQMEAQFLQNREYHIRYFMLAPRAEIQPGPNTVFEAEYIYRQKQNSSLLAELSVENNVSIQARYSQLKRGRLSSKLSTVFMHYSGDAGTALAYTMLESLQPGKNFLWELQYARNLSDFLSLSMTYNGQKSADTRPMHLGSVQLKAVF